MTHDDDDDDDLHYILLTEYTIFTFCLTSIFPELLRVMADAL